MKYTSRGKHFRKMKKGTAILLIAVLMSACLCGCGDLKYGMDYLSASRISSYNVNVADKAQMVEPFAADLCVVSADVLDAEAVDLALADAACLFDLNDAEVLYSKNAHNRMNPASLTKVMTALVALEKSTSLDQVLVASDTVKITESGAQLCGLKKGDSMTLDQALRILLLYSANDVANLIAENIGGSIEGFVELMNQKAMSIGATNTNFANPHGLTDENHYTTPYDLYLIFNEAIKYERFTEIIQMTTYQTTYYDANGKEKKVDYKTTNRFLKGDFAPPPNVTVIGGKTGTTNAAGHCLILLSRDSGGDPYISVILRAEKNDYLYQQMIELLGKINK